MRNDIIAVILAGGRSSRMGYKNKGLQYLASCPLLEYSIRALSSQVEKIIINANQDLKVFQSFKLPVQPDMVDGYLGPLMGVLSGISWVKSHYPECKSIVTTPVDTPFIPDTLVQNLVDSQKKSGSQLTFATSNGQIYPTIGLWPIIFYDALYTAVIQEKLYKVFDFIKRYRCSYTHFPANNIDPFFNINTPDDLQSALSLINKENI